MSWHWTVIGTQNILQLMAQNVLTLNCHWYPQHISLNGTECPDTELSFLPITYLTKWHRISWHWTVFGTRNISHLMAQNVLTLNCHWNPQHISLNGTECSDTELSFLPITYLTKWHRMFWHWTVILTHNISH